MPAEAPAEQLRESEGGEGAGRGWGRRGPGIDRQPQLRRGLVTLERAHDSVRSTRQRRHSEARRGRCEVVGHWGN